MNILHIISNLEIGGAQKLIADLLPELNQEKDCEVCLVVFKTCGSDLEFKLKEKGIKVISLNCEIKSPKIFFKLIPYFKWADIVHVHLFPTNYIVALVNTFFNKPLIFTEHSTHNRRRDHKILRPIEKYIYSRYKNLICISPATKDKLHKWIGEKIADNRTKIIENGINFSNFDNINPKDSKTLFGRNGIPVLMISRFTNSKDHITLIRAIALIENPEVFLVLVGDGERRKEYEAEIKKLKIENKVILLGNRNDIPDIIKASFIGVQSSNWEGFGLTAIEMMAGGLPVISSDVDGLRQVVEGAGIIFKKGSERDLADKIKCLIDDNDLYYETIRKCKKRKDSFSISKTANCYIDLYRKILET